MLAPFVVLIVLVFPSLAHGQARISPTSVLANGPAFSVAIAFEQGELVVRSTDGVPLTAREGCRFESEVVRCPTGSFYVLGGRGDDRIEISGPLGRVFIRASEGDDVVRVDRAALASGIELHGEVGEDTLDLSGVDGGVHTTQGEFETILLTPYADAFRAQAQIRQVKRVVGGAGADVLDLRDGLVNTADCGADPGDRAILDDRDTAIGCATIERPSPPALFDPPPALRPPSKLSEEWKALGLAASPQRLGDDLVLGLAAQAGATAELQASAGPWRGSEPWVALPPVRGLPADGRTPLALTSSLPPRPRALLARDGRLRVRVRLALTGPLGDVGVREGEFTIVQLPSWRGRVTGRTMRGSFGIQRFIGSPLGDLLTGASADDRLAGMAGDDRLIGGTGDDRLIGGPGDDFSDGFDGDDHHVGGPGNDHLVESRFGHDTLDGGEGDDVLIGMRAQDVLRGGPGDDILDGGSSNDELDCGPGEDIAFVSSPGEKVSSTCEEVHDGPGVLAYSCVQGGTAGPETVIGTDGDDRCAGGDGADDVEGRGGHDALDGGRGDDRVFGRFGNDVLRGGDGDDELEGGRDRDILDGGAGDDQLNGGHDPDAVAGGPGNDRILARGGGRDVVDCGPGRDVAFVDSRDVVRRCERISRSGDRRAG